MINEPLRLHRTKKNSRIAAILGAIVLGSAVVAGSVACGDAGSDSLLYGPAGTHQSSPPGPAATSTPPGSDGSVGGDPTIGPDGGVLTEAGSLQSKAETLFRALQPALISACGGTGGVCHVTGAYQNNQTPAWLAAPDAYVSAKAYPGIVVRDPYGSKIIVKGPHAGPAFTGNYKALGDQVLAWLTAESNAIQAAPIPTTDPALVTAGANTLDISKAGTGVTGAKITFNAAISGSILSLTNMKLVAPASTGVHVSHPIFVIVPATGAAEPDSVDSFSNLDQTTAAGATADFGVGTLILTDWSATAKLEISFTTLAAATGTATADAGAAGGCKSLTTFIANAVPAMQNNQCLNCHKAGGSGNGSLDLSKLGTDNAAACIQALTKVDTTNDAKSDIILAPTGGVGAHPFKGAGANYTTMMLSWINNE